MIFCEESPQAGNQQDLCLAFYVLEIYTALGAVSSCLM